MAMSITSDALAAIDRAGARTRRRAAQERPPCILLAEDDFEMRRLIASKLRKRGYDVVEAKNGDELFDILMTQHRRPTTGRIVELVISDLRMPGLTGMDVLVELRGSDWATPFILITAFGGGETRERALAEGAAAVLDKPFDLDELCVAVASLVGEPVS